MGADFTPVPAGTRRALKAPVCNLPAGSDNYARRHTRGFSRSTDAVDTDGRETRSGTKTLYSVSRDDRTGILDRMSTDDITLLDEYTGHLPERRTAAQFSTPNALVTKISLGDMDNNAYLVECKDSDKVLLIDAANDPTELVRFLRGYRSMRGLVVFTTHSHADHWLALRDIVDEFGAKTMAPAGDAEAIDVPTDEVVRHGDSIECGRISLDVITLHGHTTEGAALVLEDGGETHIFTGDSLFPGGPGKTSTPEAFTSLMDDLESRIFARYDDGVAFHPGHGDDSTLGNERPHLGEWRDRGW